MNILSRIINKIFDKKDTKHKVPFSERVIERKLIDVPNEQLINCLIETPQFSGNEYNYRMYKQFGTFDKTTMLFSPYPKMFGGIIFGHTIQYHSIDDFQKSLLRVL